MTQQGLALGAQTLAALGAARGQNLLAVLGCHPRAETMAPLALQVARLEGSFGGHGSLPLIPLGRRGNYMADPGESSARRALSGGLAPCDGIAAIPTTCHLQKMTAPLGKQDDGDGLI